MKEILSAFLSSATPVYLIAATPDEDRARQAYGDLYDEVHRENARRLFGHLLDSMGNARLYEVERNDGKKERFILVEEALGHSASLHRMERAASQALGCLA